MNHESEKNRAIDLRLVLIGILALIPGVIVYLTDRPPDKIYFIEKFPLNISLYGKISPLFGKLGYVIPEFSHVFGFILITSGILGGTRSNFLPVCLFWLVVDAFFEWGQLMGDSIAAIIPDVMNGIPFFENTSSYFRKGTFDPLDMAAIVAGAVAAYIVLRYLERNPS